MIAILTAILSLAIQAAPAEAWTWTLYEGDGPVVLANEQPDTPNLRATLECQPGSGVAQVTLYAHAASEPFATLTAGTASATVEARMRGGALRLAVRVDHPVFAAFASEGEMSIVTGRTRHAIELPRPHLAKLRRFAELCGG